MKKFDDLSTNKKITLIIITDIIFAIILLLFCLAFCDFIRSLPFDFNEFNEVFSYGSFSGIIAFIIIDGICRLFSDVIYDINRIRKILKQDKSG
ncbi:MAG: hypothetical protein NC205_08615 [Prevotella sp.]|nr:hypothetical protein [Prevotella sp.]